MQKRFPSNGRIAERNTMNDTKNGKRSNAVNQWRRLMWKRLLNGLNFVLGKALKKRTQKEKNKEIFR